MSDDHGTLRMSGNTTLGQNDSLTLIASGAPRGLPGTIRDGTHATMARVAMRAAIWSYLRVVIDGTTEDIDALTRDAVERVLQVDAQREQEPTP